MEKPGEVSGRRGGRPRRAIALAALSALLLGAVACGDDDDDCRVRRRGGGHVRLRGRPTCSGPRTPASGEPVLIGMVSDGATQAFDNTDELRAAEATAEYWNTHQGGIGGRPIEVVTCETGADPAGATDCANQMVEDGVVAVGLSQSAVADAVWEPLHAAGVPTLFFQTSAEGLLADPETSFTMVNPLATLFGVADRGGRERGHRPDRLRQHRRPPGERLVRLGGRRTPSSENAGLEYELVKIPPGTADMTSQMQQVADSGAGVVQIVGNDAFCIAAIQGLNAVGYDGADHHDLAVHHRRHARGDPGRPARGDLDHRHHGPRGDRRRGVPAVPGRDGHVRHRRSPDVDNALAMGAYTTMASLATALAGISGDITPATAAEAIKTMDEADYPGAAGLTFQCGGTVFPSSAGRVLEQLAASHPRRRGRPRQLRGRRLDGDPRRAVAGPTLARSLCAVSRRTATSEGFRPAPPSTSSRTFGGVSPWTTSHRSCSASAAGACSLRSRSPSSSPTAPRAS